MPVASHHCSVTTHLRVAAFVLATSLPLTACGGDGPLTIDEPTDEASTDDAATSDATSDPIADEPTEPSSEHVTKGHSGDDDEHPHGIHETMPTDLDMAVALEVVPDAMSGWNVHIESTGFTWTPEDVNSDAVDGEGHAHLYIDGEKWGRVYTPWLHIGGDLSPGPHEFRVTLNANDHRDYVVDGEVVEATATVDAQPADGMSHPHADTAETTAAMSVGVEVILDAMKGVNVHLTTSGFTWAPERASSDAVDGEGHAHLYVDGEKVGRLYGEWFHLSRDLEPGQHEVRVTLNANDHRDYAVGGEIVEAVATFTVPA